MSKDPIRAGEIVVFNIDVSSALFYHFFPGKLPVNSFFLYAMALGYLELPGQS